MATSMNIKNEETTRLAHELARLTGENLTTAVTEAVRERLDRVKHERHTRYERALALAEEISSHMSEAEKAFDYDAWLYDDRGLPRDC